MTDDDIAYSWHRLRLLVASFGSWVRDYRQEQSALEFAITRKAVPYCDSSRKRRYLNELKSKVQDTIRVKEQLNLERDLVVIFVGLVAFKKGVAAWCAFVMRSLEYRSLIHKKMRNAVLYNYQTRGKSRFLKKLYNKTMRRCRRRKVLSSIGQRENLRQEAIIVIQQLQKKSITSKDTKALVRHLDIISTRNMQRKILSNLISNVVLATKTKRWTAYWLKAGYLSVLQRAFTSLREFIFVQKSHAQRLQALDEYALQQALLVTMYKLESYQRTSSVSRLNNSYIDALYSTKRCRLALLKWLRLLKKRWLQRPLQSKAEKHKLTKWRFKRIGDIMDTWNHVTGHLLYHKFSIKRGETRRSCVLLQNHLDFWHIFMSFQRRNARGRVISRFHNEMTSLKKGLRALQLFANDCRESSNPRNLKCVLFWKVWRGSVVLKRWSTFVLLRRLQRDRKISKMTEAYRKELTAVKEGPCDDADAEALDKQKKNKNKEIEGIVEDGKGYYKGSVLTNPLSKLTKRVYAPLPILFSSDSSIRDDASHSRSHSHSQSAGPTTTSTTTCSSTSQCPPPFDLSALDRTLTPISSLVKAKPRTIIPDFVSLPQPLRGSTVLPSYWAANETHNSNHFNFPALPSSVAENKTQKEPLIADTSDGFSIKSRNKNIALAREIIEFVSEFRQKIHTF